eukprot:145952-Pleurochrysis_carterae.AAC.4
MCMQRVKRGRPSSSKNRDESHVEVAPVQGRHQRNVASKSRRCLCSEAMPSPSFVEETVLDPSPLILVQKAYSSIDGYEIARVEKKRQRAEGHFVAGIQYGEIEPSAFAQVLQWMGPNEGDRFLDLGSGSGKAVLTAASLYKLDLALGIEVQPKLHAAALDARSRLLALSAPPTPARLIEFRNEDAFKKQWYEGLDLVFCTTTCFTPEMIEQLQRDAEKLRVGARIAVTTRPLNSLKFRMTQKGVLPYGKGSLTFFVYVREDSQ